MELNKMIFIIKVTTNKEENAIDLIVNRIEKKELNIYSLSRPHGLRGYILLEAEERESAEEAVFNLPYVKGIIGKTITYEEIKNIVEPSAETITIKEGDIIEMIAEPFKKEKGKILRIDKQKGEVVVILLGATVPFPVTVKLDNVRVIQREGGENAN
jgi:transcription termination/antitermination protein NusG